MVVKRRGGDYIFASDGKAPLKERPLPSRERGGGGGPGDRLEDRARALSFVYNLYGSAVSAT